MRLSVTGTIHKPSIELRHAIHPDMASAEPLPESPCHSSLVAPGAPKKKQKSGSVVSVNNTGGDIDDAVKDLGESFNNVSGAPCQAAPVAPGAPKKKRKSGSVAAVNNAGGDIAVRSDAVKNLSEPFDNVAGDLSNPITTPVDRQRPPPRPFCLRHPSGSRAPSASESKLLLGLR